MCDDRDAVLKARTDEGARELLVWRLRRAAHALLADPAEDADTADFLMDMHAWFTPWMSWGWGWDWNSRTRGVGIDVELPTQLLREVGERAWLGNLSRDLTTLAGQGSTRLQGPSWDMLRDWIQVLESECRLVNSDPESPVYLDDTWLFDKSQAFPAEAIAELAISPTVGPLLTTLSSLGSLFPPWGLTLSDRTNSTATEDALFNRPIRKQLGLQGVGGDAEREMAQLLLRGEEVMQRIISSGTLQLAADAIEPPPTAELDFEFLPAFLKGSQGDFRLVRLDTQVLIGAPPSQVHAARIGLKYDFGDSTAVIHEAEPNAVTEEVDVETKQVGKENTTGVNAGARIGPSFSRLVNLGVSRSKRISAARSVRRARAVHRIKQNVFGRGVDWEFARTATFDVAGTHRLSVRALVPANAMMVTVEGTMEVSFVDGHTLDYSETREMPLPAS